MSRALGPAETRGQVLESITTATAVKPQRDTPIGLVNFVAFFSRMLPGVFSFTHTPSAPGPGSTSSAIIRYPVAIIAVALCGLGAMFGALSARSFGGVVLGCAIVFSAAWIVQKITGGVA